MRMRTRIRETIQPAASGSFATPPMPTYLSLS
jgi:hypothetical protein